MEGRGQVVGPGDDAAYTVRPVGLEGPKAQVDCAHDALGHKAVCPWRRLAIDCQCEPAVDDPRTPSRQPILAVLVEAGDGPPNLVASASSTANRKRPSVVGGTAQNDTSLVVAVYALQRLECLGCYLRSDGCLPVTIRR